MAVADDDAETTAVALEEGGIPVTIVEFADADGVAEKELSESVAVIDAEAAESEAVIETDIEAVAVIETEGAD